MLLIYPRGLLIIIGVCISLQGCGQATPEVTNDQPAPVLQTQQAPKASVTAEHIGADPDQDAVELPPDAWHGNWRLVARDDPHDQALMALSIQSSAGETNGSGDYTLHQPFCDALAGIPISGTADCELTASAGAFDRVGASPKLLLLTFHPTADGMEHRIELRKEGERLVGEYIFAANDISRPIIAERSPVQ